jgi:D-xylonolactonase
MSQVENVWNVAAVLGEGPVWVEDALWFTDIKKQHIHRFDPASGDKRSWDAPEQVGFLFPAAGGGFVAGLQSGLFRFHPSLGRFDRLIEVEPELPDNRLNDGAVDPSGRLWFGSMDDRERQRSGRFYRFEGGHVHEAGLDPVAITNGPAVSPDGRLLYSVDTARGVAHVSEIGGDGGLGGTREFLRFDTAKGFPDGPTVDAEGCVWIAFFFGWEARRYSPAAELLESVRFPVSNITKIAFGGEDLRTVYATTASHGLNEEQRAQQPEAGALFAFETGVPGFASPQVRL